ncbi:hypothetical protein [Massiliimalia massiliensis]|uniref:hypothetical protein n=1 Tax=Massiliimalia massiliensis TaxID=1852384 RepID=UPI0013564CA7|nr:hypothetical protein [Massiliimalia massiliensis]
MVFSISLPPLAAFAAEIRALQQAKAAYALKKKPAEPMDFEEVINRLANILKSRAES